MALIPRTSVLGNDLEGTRPWDSQSTTKFINLYYRIYYKKFNSHTSYVVGLTVNDVSIWLSPYLFFNKSYVGRFFFSLHLLSLNIWLEYFRIYKNFRVFILQLYNFKKCFFFTFENKKVKIICHSLFAFYQNLKNFQLENLAEPIFPKFHS